jgi:hypothetical protein
VVKKLKERGLASPYLRSFVVARINPLRWIKGAPPASRRYSEDHARACHEVRRRENQASVSRRRRGSARRRNLGEKTTNEHLIRQKTCRARAGERPAHYSGAFVRRACAYLDALGSRREPLDTLAETARIPVRISHALRLGRTGRPIFLISTMAMHTQNLKADARQRTRGPG